MSGRIYDAKKYERFLKEYRNNHRACPECGSVRNSQTYMGYILNINTPENYKDENRVTCSDCGWKGIVHDLVS